MGAELQKKVMNEVSLFCMEVVIHIQNAGKRYHRSCDLLNWIDELYYRGKMKRILMVTLLCLASSCFAQKDKGGLSQIEFILGKWKATASDSSFSSVLEYQYSPNKKMILATNYLYNKEGNLFATYEGAYLFEVDHLAYFIAGPGGETHRGRAEVKNQQLTHWAKMFPGKGVKSYKSEMQLKEGRLFYYANYSDKEDYPDKIDYTNPLIYSKRQ